MKKLYNQPDVQVSHVAGMTLMQSVSGGSSSSMSGSPIPGNPDDAI